MAWTDAEVMLASVLGSMMHGLDRRGDASVGARFYGAWLRLMRR